MVEGLRYHVPQKTDLTYDEIKEMLCKTEDDTFKLLDCLLYYCLDEIDFEMASKLCLLYFNGGYSFSRLSILCAGHIARVYGKKVDDEMVKKIHKISTQKYHPLRSEARDAINEIAGCLGLKVKDL